MAERRPREPLRATPAGARRVRVGRLVPSARAISANDNRIPLLVRARRVLYWLAVAGAAGWLIWSNVRI
jgi:hypothetical protein